MSYSFPSFNGDLSILVKIECRTSDGTIISAIRPQTRWLWWHWKPNLQCALRFYGAKNSENTRHGFDGEIEDEGYDGTSQASEGTSCWHTRYPLHLTFQFISALSSSAHVIDTSTQLPFFLLFVLHPSFGVFSHCKQACYFFSCPFRPPVVTCTCFIAFLSHIFHLSDLRLSESGDMFDDRLTRLQTSNYTVNTQREQTVYNRLSSRMNRNQNLSSAYGDSAVSAVSVPPENMPEVH